MLLCFVKRLYRNILRYKTGPGFPHSYFRHRECVRPLPDILYYDAELCSHFLIKVMTYYCLGFTKNQANNALSPDDESLTTTAQHCLIISNLFSFVDKLNYITNMGHLRKNVFENVSVKRIVLPRDVAGVLIGGTDVITCIDT